MKAARRVSDCLPLPPTPTRRALPPGWFTIREMRDKCSSTYLKQIEVRGFWETFLKPLWSGWSKESFFPSSNAIIMFQLPCRRNEEIFFFGLWSILSSSPLWSILSSSHSDHGFSMRNNFNQHPCEQNSFRFFFTWKWPSSSWLCWLDCILQAAAQPRSWRYPMTSLLRTHGPLRLRPGSCSFRTWVTSCHLLLWDLTPIPLTRIQCRKSPWTRL